MQKMNPTTPPTDKKNVTDRRLEPRLPSHIPSLLIQNDKTVYTTVVNLSAKGIGFLSAVKVPSDDVVIVIFERLDDDTMVPVSLKIRIQTCHEVDFEYYVGGSIESNSVDYQKFFDTIESAEEPLE